jgi:hypothetical protein
VLHADDTRVTHNWPSPKGGSVWSSPKGGGVICECYAQVLSAYDPQVFRLLDSCRCFRLLAICRCYRLLTSVMYYCGTVMLSF